MRASMHADGTTFRRRHTSDPAGTEDLDGRESTRGDPHKDESRCGKPRLFRPPGGYKNYFCRLGGPQLLNDFDEQRNGGNMYIDLPCQS